MGLLRPWLSVGQRRFGSKGAGKRRALKRGKRLPAVAQRAKAEAVTRHYEMMTDRAGICASDATDSISINIFGSGKAWTTQVVRAG